MNTNLVEDLMKDVTDLAKCNIQKTLDQLDTEQDPLQKVAAIKRMMKVAEDYSKVEATKSLCDWIKTELEARRYKLNQVL